MESAFEIYYKRSPRDVVENAIEPARTKGENAEWKFIKIDPIEVYYFNSELFEHERRMVVELANLREEG